MQLLPVSNLFSWSPLNKVTKKNWVIQDPGIKNLVLYILDKILMGQLSVSASMSRSVKKNLNPPAFEISNQPPFEIYSPPFSLRS